MRSVGAPAPILVLALASAVLLPSDPVPGLSLPTTPQAASSQRPAQSREVRDFEERLARLNGQIKDLRARLEAEARRETTVLTSLARINLNKSIVERELAAQNVELERGRADLVVIQENVRVIRGKIDRQRESLDRTLVTLYKYGRIDFLQVLLQARDVEAYAAESKHLSILARGQDRVVAEYQASLEELRAAESALESKQTDLAAMARAAKLKRQELDTEARKNATLVQEIRRNRATYGQTLKELSESAEELQKLMAKIASQEWVLPPAWVPLYERRGRLPWPLEGRVITAYGFEKNPNFNTVVMNKGVEIAPGRGKTLILAVHPGKVVYADYFQGYGNLLIVDHGLTYYSLYGHCSEFLAAVGDMVRAGQPVALVGDTGSLKGECLYFEIRQKTKALDPLQWLKRR
ncbi:MAG TPA: peptidoglycan DD-metalloendopeptidase family protein [Candidatus Aminicenantes bacterium]|nr:peptidoglycan DD-metalloendopeptidase family protein [Candidatus Aminicenantes bacterium]HRY66144.1 peptidoglycan DD-metalloendopeptidase family protein [Candidatus Aminicenantes bacterium]HRZ73058.1 peptidoglycan DD-metalloendopeptidase family protein [Candidatus Aminicenantes bacterium]